MPRQAKICDCLGLELDQHRLGLGMGSISIAWEKLQQCLGDKEKAWVLRRSSNA